MAHTQDLRVANKELRDVLICVQHTIYSVNTTHHTWSRYPTFYMAHTQDLRVANKELRDKLTAATSESARLAGEVIASKDQLNKLQAVMNAHDTGTLEP